MKISKSDGFTLVELLVVIAVLSVLAAASAAVFTQVLPNNRDQQRIRDLTTFKQSLELYRFDNRSFPATLSDLPAAYLSPQPAPPGVGESYQYQSGPANCTTSGKSCTSFILCTKKEGNGSQSNPAGCSALNCETGVSCGMGLSSD